MYIDVLLYFLIIVAYFLKILGFTIFLINTLDIYVVKKYNKKSLLNY